MRTLQDLQSPQRPWLAACMAVGLVLVGMPMARARCADDLPAEIRSERPVKPGSRAGAAPAAQGQGATPRNRPAEADADDTPPVTVDPMTQLRQVAIEADRRSAAVGAARLLQEAAELDVDETKAGYWPQVSVGATLGKARSFQYGLATTPGSRESDVNLNVGGPLWDNGRLNRLTDYRSELAKAAQFGTEASREAVIVEAVLTAIERNRYRLQAQAYQQYMRKMSCLVEALEGIVSEDRGRASELVQARKTQAQAELQRDQALAQSRQNEIKLHKLLGDQFSPGEGITLPLALMPELGEINRQIEQANDVQQMRSQIDAQDEYTRSLLASQLPQLGWNAGTSQGNVGGIPTRSWHAGVTVSYSLFNGFSDAAVREASAKRTEAMRQQLAELLANKHERTAEMYDVAVSAFDRAKRYGNVLKDSEKVRNFTFMQWSQLGRRSLFDVMSAESDHFNLRVAYVNAMHDGYVATAQLRSLGSGLANWLLAGPPR